MNYGAITTVDAKVMDEILDTWHNEPVRVLEIGVWTGQTARGIKYRCNQNGCVVDYWGIDSKPFDGPIPPWIDHYILSPSEEAALCVPNEFDFIFVDGCHCFNHVLIDAFNYGQKVVVGGIIAFHDTAPQVQGVQKNPWLHGTEDKPQHRTAVVRALEGLGWPNARWELFRNAYDPASDIGGMMAFRKRL